MDKQSSFQEIYHEILKGQNILIAAHQNPDGDALGSLTALAHFLKKNNKNFTLFCAGIVGNNYLFLPYSDQIFNQYDHLIWQEYDTAIILDSGDLEYAKLPNLKKYPIKIINIDHHKINDFYGDLNLVLPKASATAEIIWQLFDVNKVRIDQTMATSLLTGIITDTNNFSNAGTTPQALSIAADLIEIGADQNFIIKKTLRNKSLDTYKKWGEILKNLSYNKKYNIASLIISNHEADDNYHLKFDSDSREFDGLSNYLNNVLACKILIVLKETSDGQIIGGLRTTDPALDISTLGQALGGGGHAKAAGFSLKGKLVKQNNSYQII